MRKTVYSVATALAVAAFLPYSADTQAQAKPAAPLIKQLRPVQDNRWGSMLSSASVLAHEGTEVRRITPQEKQALDGMINKVRGDIARVKKDGKISEAEEDAIDREISDVMVRVAQFMSDPQRKAAAPGRIPVPAKAPTK